MQSNPDFFGRGFGFTVRLRGASAVCFAEKSRERLRKIGNLADLDQQGPARPLTQCQPTMAASPFSERHHTRSQAVPRFANASTVGLRSDFSPSTASAASDVLNERFAL